MSIAAKLVHIPSLAMRDRKLKIPLRRAYSHPSYPGEDGLHRILTAPKREVVSSRTMVDLYATRTQILPRRLGSKTLTAGSHFTSS